MHGQHVRASGGLISTDNMSALAGYRFNTHGQHVRASGENIFSVIEAFVAKRKIQSIL